MAFLIMANLSEDLAHRLAGDAIVERFEVTFRDHLWHQQHEQLFFQPKETPQCDETDITPMAFEERRAEPIEHFSHEPGVFLLFADEKIDAGDVIGIACASRAGAEMPAFTALTNLKLLNGAYEVLSDGLRQLHLVIPMDWEPMIPIMLKVLKPVHLVSFDL